MWPTLLDVSDSLLQQSTVKCQNFRYHNNISGREAELHYSKAWVFSVQLALISAKLFGVQRCQHWTPLLTSPTETHHCLSLQSCTMYRPSLNRSRPSRENTGGSGVLFATEIIIQATSQGGSFNINPSRILLLSPTLQPTNCSAGYVYCLVLEIR